MLASRCYWLKFKRSFLLHINGTSTPLHYLPDFANCTSYLYISPVTRHLTSICVTLPQLNPILCYQQDSAPSYPNETAQNVELGDTLWQSRHSNDVLRITYLVSLWSKLNFSQLITLTPAWSLIGSHEVHSHTHAACKPEKTVTCFLNWNKQV